ncbi:hypothetical protein ACFFX0_16835 [Citricoccus parietis]|uniref:Uncharacterized protein n=1 Tax=Citricoccus parietis TaxID=592307 RepID=A0ABV5G1G2_9MICC
MLARSRRDRGRLAGCEVMSGITGSSHGILPGPADPEAGRGTCRPTSGLATVRAWPSSTKPPPPSTDSSRPRTTPWTGSSRSPESSRTSRTSWTRLPPW